MRILCILGLASLGIFVAGAQTGKSSPEASAAPAPPPSAAAKVSAADLEKLVAPIALYPDSLIATLLPASVYPLEVVQAARFVRDTNNLAKLDEQPWDENVKAVARIPEVIQQMDGDIAWMSRLGEAFLAQDKDVMDAIQAMRGKAQKAGTLQTTPQQVVTVTNMVVEKTIEQQVVVVTNTIVQIQPASSSVVYVPTYNPYTVYYPPPAYYVNPYPLLTFGAGMAMGAIIANNCNWHHGGCYNNNININNNYNQNNNFNRNNNNNNNLNRTSQTGQGQKWQPDQSRLNKSGAPSAASREARGWGSGSGTAGAGAGGARPSTGAVGTRPSTGNVGARPSTGTAAARPSTGTAAANRPSASPSTSRPASPSSMNRSSGGSGGSAFGGMSSGSSTRSTSSRGAASRGGGGGGRSGGGGGRR